MNLPPRSLFSLLLLASAVSSTLAASSSRQPILQNFGNGVYEQLFARAAEIPTDGAWEFLILSPTVVEVRLVNERRGPSNRPTYWDWVNESNGTLTPAFPTADRFRVLEDDVPVAITRIGYRRSPYFAPLEGSTFRMTNHLIFELERPLAANAVVKLEDPGSVLLPKRKAYSRRLAPNRWSPVIHVNQTGYEPGAIKKAYAGYWLGTLGELDLSPGIEFQVLRRSNKAIRFRGNAVLRPDSGFRYLPAHYQEVLELDFSAFQESGDFLIRIPDLGLSFPFWIGQGASGVLARTYAHGLLHQRSGFDHRLPFTRFVDPPGHTAPATIPLPAANNPATWGRINSTTPVTTSPTQIAPRLSSPETMLFPYVDPGPVDVSQGHMDAGDYSKYTTNASLSLHTLLFAAEALPGVAELDNLGIPESGDGISDVLQEALWEADFLAKMQDDDGGFYFQVWPRNRSFEHGVFPSGGDPQVVWPKTTAVTASATAALAEAASSPLLQIIDPDRAALYRDRALLGWAFLQNAFAEHGIDGSFQALTAYGLTFGHADELAWAACALFVLTGDRAYQDLLMQWLPNPDSRDAKRWTWRRMFEGYGAALRTYAFAPLTGRLPESALDPNYRILVENTVVAAGNDVVARSRSSSYGVAFPAESKAHGSAGWFFALSESYDALVAHLLRPDPKYIEAVEANAGYVCGANPLDMPFVTGLGWRRQRVIVSQFAEVDHAVLPPTGIPIGALQSGPIYLGNYAALDGTNMLSRSMFPNTTPAVYPFYDRWSDSWNTTTEFVIVDLVREASVAYYRFAATPLRNQPWQALPTPIAGVPEEPFLVDSMTASLEPGIDLTGARVTWEALGYEPYHGPTFTFLPDRAGSSWIEAEAILPDGRRLHAAGQFHARQTLPTWVEQFQPLPAGSDPNVVAYYPLNSSLEEARNRFPALRLEGNASLDSKTFVFPGAGGSALRVGGSTGGASVPLSGFSAAGASEVSVEAMIYLEEFTGYGNRTSVLLELLGSGAARLSFTEGIWTPAAIASQSVVLLPNSKVTSLITPFTWHHLRIAVHESGYRVSLNGLPVAELIDDDLPPWLNLLSATLTIGHFRGWIDEVTVRAVRYANPNPVPEISLTGAPQMELSVGDVFADPGASALDYLGQEIAVSVSGTVKTTTAGVYKLRYTATDANGIPAPALERLVTVRPSDALPPSNQGTLLADYRFEDSLLDSTGRQLPLTLTGGAFVQDGTLHVANTTDGVRVSIPAGQIYQSGQTTGVLLEGRILPLSYPGYPSAGARCLTLEYRWNVRLHLARDPWNLSPSFRANDRNNLLLSAALDPFLTKGSWHTIHMLIDRSGYRVWIDRQLIYRENFPGDLIAWSVPVSGLLQAGSFTGQLDDLRILRLDRKPYELWREAEFTAEERSDPFLIETVSGPKADPDGDRIFNQDEYAFGLAAKVPDQVILARGFIHRDPDGKSYVALRFQRLLDRTDVRFRISHSTDLIHWDRGGQYYGDQAIAESPSTVEISRTPNGDFETIEVRARLSVQDSGSTRQFLKLETELD